MLHTNVAAVVQNGTTYYNQNVGVTCVEQDEGGAMVCDGTERLSLSGGLRLPRRHPAAPGRGRPAHLPPP